MTQIDKAGARQGMDDKEFLLALREYIEDVEMLIESDRGVGRSLEEVIAEGEMTPLYSEVLRRLGVDGASAGERQ